MYPAGLCERWAGFFWQLPLLVYIIWLNFLPMTSLAPCYTTCGVKENPPSHTHIMQPPHSLYFFLIPPLSPPRFPSDLGARHPSLHHFRLCFFLSSDQVLFPPPTVFSSLPHFIPPYSLHPYIRSSLQACENTCFLRPVVCMSVSVCK